MASIPSFSLPRGCKQRANSKGGQDRFWPDSRSLFSLCLGLVACVWLWICCGVSINTFWSLRLLSSPPFCVSSADPRLRSALFFFLCQHHCRLPIRRLSLSAKSISSPTLRRKGAFWCFTSREAPSAFIGSLPVYSHLQRSLLPYCHTVLCKLCPKHWKRNFESWAGASTHVLPHQMSGDKVMCCLWGFFSSSYLSVEGLRWGKWLL